MLEFHFLKKFKERRLSSARDIEPQEVFLDRLAQKREEDFGITTKKFEVPLSKRTLQGFLLFSLFIFLILFAKTFQFQVLEGKKFSALAKENKFIVYSIKSDRGVMYDKFGKQLVFNKPGFNLIFNKKVVPESESERQRILKEVSLIIEEDLEEIKEKIDQEQGDKVLISENIDHQKLILLETKKADLLGFETEKSTIRNYEDGRSFSHLIGYTGRITTEELNKEYEDYSNFDYVGKIGIEKSYEEILRKNPGKIQIERDVFGNEISKKVISLPEPGQSLILWLDSNLQKKIEEELIKTMEAYGAEKAVGIALDPKTGGILALVNLPNFDNNLFSKQANEEDLKSLLIDEKEPLFNRAIAGSYTTGSTIKPIVAAAALEEKLISPSKSLNCQGKITIPHRYDPEIDYEYKDWRTHGRTDLRKAIAESCNVYFYTIGGGYKDQEGLGPSKLKQYLELFGWGNKTEIDIPNESEGFIPSTSWKKEHKGENWWDGDTYNLSIGQGDITITPLQVVNSFAAIANGGTLYKPKTVKEIVDSEKRLIQEINPEILKNNFVDSKNLEIVREGMRNAVTGQDAPHASSVLLNSLPVSSAAKTGTAQTPYPNHYHNWISVFAPYENPEIVLTLMVENVEKSQAIVIPTARNILQWYFSE